MKFTGNTKSGRHLDNHAESNPTGIAVIGGKEITVIDLEESSVTEDDELSVIDTDYISLNDADYYSAALTTDDIPLIDDDDTSYLSEDDLSALEAALNSVRDREAGAVDQETSQTGYAGMSSAKMSRKKKVIIILAAVIVLLVGAAAYAINYVRSAIQTPPPVNPNPTRPVSPPSQSPDATAPTLQPGQPTESPDVGESGDGVTPVRDPTKYTFLVMGYGEHDGNTDVIMAVTFDTTNYKLEIVNIPRDTLANVSWNLKKVNSIYAHARQKYDKDPDRDVKAMQDTQKAISDIVGYEFDFWVQLNMRALVTLINAIGGVDFYVPVHMEYEDIAGGLYIYYTKGMHHLNGQQALEVLRFRSGYASADIGRIDTQQSFLKAAAQQILAKRSSLNIVNLANIFIGNVNTDMELKDLIWFGNEFLRLEAENINFYTMPGNTIDLVGNESYVTIYLDEWLELVNSKFSPFYDDLGPEDVSILTRGADRYLYVTDGNRQGDPSWGAYSTGVDPSKINWDNYVPPNSANNPGTAPGAGDDDGDDDDSEPSDGDPESQDIDSGTTGLPSEEQPVDGPDDTPYENIAPLDEDPYQQPDNDSTPGSN